jgi:peroxiredoxin (alkyl hydroperoxide reductase subunit C)
VGISVDSAESHFAWSNAARKDGGLGGPLAYPLVSDLSGAISEAFGCRWLSGHSCRATYILDPNGTVKHLSMNADECGRSVDEILRLLTALQYAEGHPGEACPVGWAKGHKAIKADPVGSKEYFAAVNKKK